MNVRLTPRGQPRRTDLYTGVVPPILFFGDRFSFRRRAHPRDEEIFTIKDYEAIELDEEGAVT